MSRMPQMTVGRRSPLGGQAAVPRYIVPGEMFTHIAPNGTPTLYVGGRDGTPVPVMGGGGGGGGGPSTIPTVKPNAPVAGSTWYDAVRDMVQVYTGTVWRDIFDDAHLMALDGARTATGTFDMAGHDLDDVGTVTADAVEGAVVSGGNF